MYRLRLTLFVLISCFVSYSFASNQFPFASSQHIKINKSSRILDLKPLLKHHMYLAIKDPETGMITYTKDGKFIKKGNYFYQGNSRLQGYPVPTELTSNDCKLTDVKAPDERLSPTATSHVKLQNVNLYSGTMPPTVTPFDPNNYSSFSYVMGGNIIDSLGERYNLSLYFCKVDYNSWFIYACVDNVIINTGRADFNAAGQLTSATGLTGLQFNPTNGAAPLIFDINMDGTTQYGSPCSCHPMEINGNIAADYLEEIVDDNGYISDSFTNGITILFSKIAVFSR